MKGILLAAGKGTRISKYIKDIPKSTSDVDGTSLIRRNVELLIKRNIEPIVCVGYNKEHIYKALEGLEVKYYVNPFYNMTNSIVSLWFAKDEITDDLLIINADVYFLEDILDMVLDKKNNTFLVVDTSKVDFGDYFLKIENGIIKDYGKDLTVNERNCEYVGIGKVDKVFLEEFRERLEYLIDSKKYNLWWENILYSFIEEKKIYTFDIKGTFWCEIDCLDDYKKIINYINENKQHNK